MSGTTTGIAPGFGGFAVTPTGQAQYDARRFNPYGFLQQPVDTGTAPASSSSMLARGGLVGMHPWQRLDAGGDAGDDAGADAGSAADAAGSAADATGGAGDNGANDAAAAAGAAGLAATDPSQADDPTMAQTMFGVAKSGLMGMVPGLGLANAALGLSNKAGAALGIAPESPGAIAGTGIMGTIGGMIGGPLGAAALGALGGYMGAHGGSGPGMGGTGANAGTNDVGTSVAGQGGYANGPTSNAGSVSNMGESSSSPDIASLIQKIHGAMATPTPIEGGLGAAAITNGSPLTQGLAAGGMAMGMPHAGLGAAVRHRAARVPNHNFHAGSGLVHGTSDGRADALHTMVPAHSYVIPADALSSLGGGNTMAGAKKMTQMMPKQAPGFAGGGSVPVRLSAGEYVVHPRHVAALGGGDIKAGSDKLDAMVGHVRRLGAAAVARMPAPR